MSGLIGDLATLTFNVAVDFTHSAKKNPDKPFGLAGVIAER
jgi:hypothetical protein